MKSTTKLWRGLIPSVFCAAALSWGGCNTTAPPAAPAEIAVLSPSPGTVSTGSLQVQVLTSSCGANQMQDFFQVVNTGTTSIALSDIAIKFWADDTSKQSLVPHVSYGGCVSGVNGNPSCTHQTSGVTATATTLAATCGPDAQHAGNWEIKISDTDGTLLPPGATWGNIQSSVNLGNFSNISPGTADWFSPCLSGTSYVTDPRFAVYLNGNLVLTSGASPPLCPTAVQPSLECVTEQDAQHFTALFSYSNGSAQPITVTGSANTLSPATANGAQPTTFLPGVHRNAFAVPFNSSPLTWSLNGQTASASSASPLCAPATFSPNADTSVDPAHPTQNFGTSQVLSTGTSFIQFDTAAIKAALGVAAIVTTAQLQLTVPSGTPAGTSVAAHLMKRPWTETGATFACANATPTCAGLDNWTLASPTISQVLPWVDAASDTEALAAGATTLTLDVSADLRELLSGKETNFGWALLAGGAAPLPFGSRESATPPRLLVQYSTFAPGTVPLSVTVDTTLVPVSPTITSLADGVPRPLARFVDPEGVLSSDFVSTELVLFTNDSAAINSFVKRWNGTVLAVNPGLTGVAATPNMTLVRIDPTLANTASLVPWLAWMDNRPQGNHRVSSTQGLQLLAAATAEAAAGTPVGINWIMNDQSFIDRQIQDGTGPEGTNAFSWADMHHNTPVQSNVMDTGVAEAWRAMTLAGRLTAGTIVAGIIDGGYKTDADWSTINFSFSPLPFVPVFGTKNPSNCQTGGDCSWHGTDVVHTGFGIPNNSFGGAGPGGPVSNLEIVDNFGDWFTNVGTVPILQATGSQIINMSFADPVPWIVAWSVLPFQAVTRAARDLGTLEFAAAGNSGRNTDDQACANLLVTTVCWRKFWWTPCQNDGVTCVGGADSGTNRNGLSNFGSHVNIYGPWAVDSGNVAGETSDDSAYNNNQFGGTSAATPFVAGVAALVWAADTSQNANAIVSRLRSTARIGVSPNNAPIVNALDAVIGALGPNLPPHVEITAPADGSTFGAGGFGVPLQAEADDYNDPTCCAITWTSSRAEDNPMGSGPSITFAFPDAGDRVVTATATDVLGRHASASITLHIQVFPPSTTISAPAANANVFQGVPFMLVGSGQDPQQLGGLPCGSLLWTSLDQTIAGFPATGCTPTVVFNTLGPETVTLTGTDSVGLSGSSSVSFTVVPAPAGPIPQITFPNVPGQEFGGPVQVQGQVLGGSGTITAVWSDNGTPFATVTVAASSGGASVNPNFSLGNGSHSVILTATDSTGASNASAPIAFLVQIPK